MLLLLGSAAMVTAPGRGTADAAARSFYSANVGVILLAQVIGLLAAAAFVAFAKGLDGRQVQSGRDMPRSSVALAGWSVALAAGLTAVPVLWLSAVAQNAGSAMLHALLAASDLTDMVLFAAITTFALATAAAARDRWVSIWALVVGALAAARALLLLFRSDALEMVAPMAFLSLVLLLSAAALARRPLLRPRPASPRVAEL